MGKRTIDLFSGCGGMSLGFQNAGFNIVAAYDNWTPAVSVYRDNFEHPIINEDLTSAKVLGSIKSLCPDCIIGGPPCQDFSSAGHRNELNGRASLTIVFADIVCKVRPSVFVMENVVGITKSNTFKQAIKHFKEKNYGLTSIVINASYCGVPQKRKRFFLVGLLNGTDDYFHSSLLENQSTKPLTMHEYFGDSLGVEFYFRIPRSYSRRGVFSIYEPCVTIRGVDRPIPKGYKKHPGDLVEIGDKVRCLTVKERSYVQTFPTDFNFTGTKTNLNQMIGNAVPVKLAEHVARSVLRSMELNTDYD